MLNRILLRWAKEDYLARQAEMKDQESEEHEEPLGGSSWTDTDESGESED